MVNRFPSDSYVPCLPSAFGSLPCLAPTCLGNIKSTSCIDLSVSELGPRPSPRPRVLLKAPTLAEMEEMNIFEVRSHLERLAHVGVGSTILLCFVFKVKWVEMLLYVRKTLFGMNSLLHKRSTTYAIRPHPPLFLGYLLYTSAGVERHQLHI